MYMVKMLFALKGFRSRSAGIASSGESPTSLLFFFHEKDIKWSIEIGWILFFQEKKVYREYLVVKEDRMCKKKVEKKKVG